MVYMPPKPRDAASSAVYAETVERIRDWLHEWVGKWASKSRLCVLGDVNDGLGYPCLDKPDRHISGLPVCKGAIGVAEAAREHLAGSAWREICETHYLYCVSSHTVTGPTFYGTREGANSKIDHLALSWEMQSWVVKCTMMRTAGRRLQLVANPHPVDH